MATNPSLLGRVLAGRYRLQRRRGAGAHGVVLDAHDEQLDRAVAVKIMMPQFVADTAAEARFRFEAQAAASLTHPNLNAVYDWGVEEIEGAKVPYLVLEHLSGGSVRDMLDRGRLLTPSQALVVGLDACRGLDFMHRRGVIHRDLSPANLAFGDDRHLRILDVGLSRLVAEQIWADPSSAGTDAARYASPEQAVGGTVEDGTITSATDIYTLALILIETVTGQVPFLADSTVATLSARVDKLMPVSADFGPLASVLSRAGSAKPADRYSAAEFGRALVQAAEKLPRPLPLPIVGQSSFADTTGPMRRPDQELGDAVAVTTLLPLLAEPPLPPAPQPIDPRTGQPPGPPPMPHEIGATVTTPATTDPPVLFNEEFPDQPRRRRRRNVLIGVFVLLAALAAGAFVAVRLLADKQYTVPELAGQTEGVARNNVAGNNWTIVTQRERSDEQPEGTVIRTEPDAGQKLKEGQTIVFVVSDGPTLSALPDVTGQSLEQASSTLDAAKLAIEVAEEVFSEDIPTGIVISWTVPAQPGLTVGMDVMQQTVVSVVVSKGPQPRVVPNLVGLDPAAAQAAVEGLQLKFVRDVDRFSPDVPLGIVMDQSVPAGTEIARGETVVVAVSKGIEYIPAPSLAGLNLDQIKATLESVGLALGTVTGPSDGSGMLVRATVNGVGVFLGDPLPRGTALDLEYAPPPTTTSSSTP